MMVMLYVLKGNEIYICIYMASRNDWNITTHHPITTRWEVIAASSPSPPPSRGTGIITITTELANCM